MALALNLYGLVLFAAFRRTGRSVSGPGPKEDPYTGARQTVQAIGTRNDRARRIRILSDRAQGIITPG